MQIVTFTQLRNHAKKYFDAVERGESIEIYRKGKPIAVLSPLRRGGVQRWKTARPIQIHGASLTDALLAERDERG